MIVNLIEEGEREHPSAISLLSYRLPSVGN
jgi:hypothetical protein